MIRVTFNAPVMDAALIDIEEAVGLEDQDEKTRYLVGELEAVIARAEGRR